MSEQELKNRIAEARLRVASFDQADRQNGTRSPSQVGLTELILVAMEALKAGLMNPESCAQFDAVIYLEDAARTSRSREYTRRVSERN